MSPRPRRTTRLAAALLGAVATVFGLQAIGSWDVWWHLATGRLALQEGSTLPVDVFSMTRAGAPWVYKDLGADVLYYGLYSLAGEAGLAALKLVLALALMALLARLARRRFPAAFAWLPLAGLAFLVGSFRVIARPELFSLVGLAALLLLVERWRRSPPPRGGGVAVGLVALTAVWANLHRGVVLGVAVLVGFALYELASAVERALGRPGRWLPSAVATSERPWRTALTTAAVTCLAGLATLLNPSGTALWTQSLAVGTDANMAQTVSEWANLSLAELVSAFPLAVLWMAAVVLIVPVAYVRARRRDGGVDLWDVGLAALGVYLGLSAVRFLPFMAFLTLGPLAAALRTLVDRSADEDRPPRTWEPAALGLGALLVLVAALADPRLAVPEPGFARDRYPEQAVDLMLEAPVVGEGFTTFVFAGYVLYHLWPEKHVFCDGRYDGVYDGATMQACFAAERDPALLPALQEAYELEWVLAHNQSGTPRDPSHPRAFDYLDVAPDWVLVYWDAASLLYVRRAGPNGWLAAPLGYTVLRPHDPDVSLMQALEVGSRQPAVLARLNEELRRLQEAAPDDYRTHVLLALYLHGIGATDTDEFRLVVEALRSDRDTAPAVVDQVLDWIGEH